MYPKTIQVYAKSDGSPRTKRLMVGQRAPDEGVTYYFDEVASVEEWRKVATFLGKETAEAATRAALDTLPGDIYVEWDFYYFVREPMNLWD